MGNFLKGIIVTEFNSFQQKLFLMFYLLNLPDPGYCNSDHKMSQNYLNDLNESQRQAVSTQMALPCYCRQAPEDKGTDYRIATAEGVPRRKDTCPTFTNKAAREMKEGSPGSSIRKRFLWMAHSIHLCKDPEDRGAVWDKPNYTIYDSSDSKAS
jgi:hypothetical protein